MGHFSPTPGACPPKSCPPTLRTHLGVSLSAASGVPRATQALYDIRLKLDGTAYHWCPPHGLGIGATTGSNDPVATTLQSYIGNGGSEHGLVSLHVPGCSWDAVEALSKVEWNLWLKIDMVPTGLLAQPKGATWDFPSPPTEGAIWA